MPNSPLCCNTLASVNGITEKKILMLFSRKRFLEVKIENCNALVCLCAHVTFLLTATLSSL